MKETEVAAGFAALAQTTRIELLRLLAIAGPSGMTAGSISKALAVQPSRLSFHLATLTEAGLVKSVRHGRQVLYSTRLAGLRTLFGFLTQTCCANSPAVCDQIDQFLSERSNEEAALEPAYNVLFICTRNSARSILAEAVLQKIGRGKFNAYSAGSDPARMPMPEVLDRLSAMGHDVSQLRSKSWNEFTGDSAPRMDFVITLCDPVDGEACPDLGSRPITAVWPFPDPAKFNGSDVERTALLNGLYGMIRRRIEAFVHLPFSSLDRIALKARLDELAAD
jgi:protein-tyrosine-phosphatase/DNA-binding transcriptional ArsR family regulator